MDVPPRDLLCRPLPALKDNRAEAEQHHVELLNGADNGTPAASYRVGLYATMDWVAARMRKAGAAAWAYIFGGEQVECFSAIEFECISCIEFECLAAISACLA